MRASQQRIMMAGAGAFMLLSSSLTLLQQSLVQHPAVQQETPKQLSQLTLRGTPVPLQAVKVGEISANIKEIHSDAREAVRIIERYNGMLVQPGRQFVLELPDSEPIRFDNMLAEPVLIKSWVSSGQANLVFYKGVS